MPSNQYAPDSKAGKIESVRLAVRSSFGVGYIVRAGDANGWRDVVGKTLWRVHESK
jgi:hypothetical protein